MKKKIRLGTFETNSSSVHSIVINKEGLEKPNLTVKRKKIDGVFKHFIYVPLQTFDKYSQTFYSQEDKLSYLVTIAFLSDGGRDLENMKESYSYEIMEKEIVDYCNQYGINVEGFWIDPKTEKDAYIDHQSIEDYYSVSDFINVMKLDYVDFVFNKYVSLHTDCD